MRLGWAVGRVFARRKGRRRILIGKDTRISGYMLESVLEAGLVLGGCRRAICWDTMPTPGCCLPHPHLACRRGHRHQRVAQPVLRQRHQVLRRSTATSWPTKPSSSHRSPWKSRHDLRGLTINWQGRAGRRRLVDATSSSAKPPWSRAFAPATGSDTLCWTAPMALPTTWRQRVFESELGATLTVIGADPDGTNHQRWLAVQRHPEMRCKLKVLAWTQLTWALPSTEMAIEC